MFRPISLPQTVCVRVCAFVSWYMLLCIGGGSHWAIGRAVPAHFYALCNACIMRHPPPWPAHPPTSDKLPPPMLSCIAFVRYVAILSINRRQWDLTMIRKRSLKSTHRQKTAWLQAWPNKLSDYAVTTPCDVTRQPNRCLVIDVVMLTMKRINWLLGNE